MRLTLDRLHRHLRDQLCCVYVVTGDEPLQVEECLDAVRGAARAAGITTRIVLHAQSGFDWEELRAHQTNRSLFGDRQILELRLASSKPGKAGAEALRAYAARPNPDNVLLVSGGKLERRELASAWYRALEGAGAGIQVWPVDAARLPQWVAGRAKRLGLALDREAVQILADRVEGNLLACAQELDKLHLLHGKGKLGLEAVLASVGDSARFSVYDLADSALSGDGKRTVRITAGLAEEGVDPVLASWALAREVRALASMAHALEHGQPLEQVLRAHRVWDRRKGLVAAALGRRTASGWLDVLRLAMRTDRVIKGAEPGTPWAELERLGLALAGTMLFN